MTIADWQRHEREVNDALSIVATIASGRTPGDKGDGKTIEHPYDSDRFQIQVDEKCTTHHSYSINYDYMKKCIERAGQEGKMFLLPVRFQFDDDEVHDFIVLQLSDFSFMLGYDQLKTLREKVKNEDEDIAAIKKKLQSLSTEIDNVATAIKDIDAKNSLYHVLDSIDDIVSMIKS